MEARKCDGPTHQRRKTVHQIEYTILFDPKDSGGDSNRTKADDASRRLARKQSAHIPGDAAQWRMGRYGRLGRFFSQLLDPDNR